MSIGYACILLGDPECNIKGITLKNASPDKLDSVILHNLTVLDRIVDYNINNNIKLFRISSDIIPFGSHSVNQLPWWNTYKHTLSSIGRKIRAAGMRVSMHPGQYTILNSPNEHVVDQAVDDLIYHARFLDTLGVGPSHKIILHVGGVYGDKDQAIQRFMTNYEKLSQNIKDRLVIENDERCYSINDVLEIGAKLSIPVIFDNLHHEIYPATVSTPRLPLEWIALCSETWKFEKDGIQKIHYSQQAEGGKLGSHSQTIDIKEFLRFYKDLKGTEIDIMLEVKDKNLSALKCIHSTTDSISVHLLEREWSKYKYLILSHSHTSYLEIREMLKNKKSLTPLDFYQKIEAGLQIPPTIGSQTNAALHIWGYFKNIADIKEKNRFNKLLDNFESGLSEVQSIKNHLFKLTLKYDMDYLKYSYYYL